MFVYVILLSLLCSSFSLSVVAAPTSQTGQAARGSRTRTTSGWFLIAAVKLPVTSAASGIIPPTSTRWRWVDRFIRLWQNVELQNCKIHSFPFLMRAGRLHHEIRGIHPESFVYPRCSGHWHCISAGKTLYLEGG